MNRMQEDSLLEADSRENILEHENFANDLQQDETKAKSWLEYVKLITVEPTMFLYMLAFMVTSVVEQAFFIYKACRVDLGFPEEICKNLTQYKEKNKEVQVVVSTFHQNNDIASHLIPIVLALFIGAWSDRRGRKLLLLLGLGGKLWYSIWIVINSLQETWTLSQVIWTASLPSGLTGADLAIFAAAFSYISDITTLKNRTLRITVLDVTYLTSMPIGVALGKLLFHYLNRTYATYATYATMFSLNALLLLIALLYSFFRLDWATNPHQKPLKLCCLNVKSKFIKNDNEKNVRQPYCFLDFFDKEHLIESIKTITRKRSTHGRGYLILLILAMGLYTFQRGTLLCVPLMGKFFKFADTTMVIVGTLSHSVARMTFALAEKPWMFYLGASLASVGPVVAPVLRSMASKIVPENERGKVFAVLSVADTTVPLFSGIVYSQVYNATIHSYPAAIFWVTVGTQMIVLSTAL
ncbi:hypothetical protein RUM44_009190 [Polyplax serrata]|uniref:Proton-coupled folate transporter n=1 Tax=Polyplax serrata TaxID=468196 RepID=A0ABR1AS01_POLSC